MGVILAKFRKENSTQAVLEDLQEKIATLETYTVNTQEQKKRIVGNFLAVSIGVYVIAFVVFYFVYFPPTWKERIVYCIPLLLFPIIIILLRYLFTWYFQRKLNKNSKKLTALRAQKKKILEQVMDKETYKVAVNLLARFGDKQSVPSLALTTATPNKNNQLVNRSLAARNLDQQKATQLSLTSTPSSRITANYLGTPTLISQINTPSPTVALLGSHNSRNNQQLRRRTPFPIVNQQQKGVFDRIVDVLIGDGPQDRFAMICKECYSHNGMALKDDFEYTTFRCAFCNALNPSRKTRPVAPRLSVMAPPATASASSDSSDSEDDKKDSGNEPSINLDTNRTQFATPTNNITGIFENQNTTGASVSSTSSDGDEEKTEATIQPQSAKMSNEGNKEIVEATASLTDLLKQLEKSDSAIEDTSMSPE